MSGSSSSDSHAAGAVQLPLSHTFIKSLKLEFNRLPWRDHLRRRRQRLQKILAVALPCDSAIKNHDSAVIGAGADQPAEPLLEANGRVREHEGREGVAAARIDGLDPRRCDRLGRHLERKFGDDETSQWAAGNVHSLPE